MTIRPDNTLISNREMIIELVTLPFRAFGEMIYKMAENNSRVQALQAIAAMSDDDLRAKGLTRSDVISMTFRHDG